MWEAKHVLIDCGARQEPAFFAEDCFHCTYEARSGVYRLGVVLRESATATGAVDDEDEPSFIIGDAQDDTRDGSTAGWLGNGIRMTFDLTSNVFALHSSLSGLPCLYSYEDGARRVFATSVALIAAFLGGHIEFDETGILDLAVVGHPVGDRTLFKNLSLVGAGTRIVWEGGRVRRDTWTADAGPRCRDYAEYMAALADACDAAIARMDLSDAFLSLTAGLDTRAILALLIKHDKLVAGFTIAGSRGTIDSQRAADLSRRYGIEHRTVYLADDFCARLPAYCESASLLSGGVASIGQSHEMHFYAELPRAYAARLSGALGNQVGRSGTEGISMRCIDSALLSRRMSKRAAAMREGHWFDRLEGSVDRASLRFLVQQENLFASQANYCVGHHHAAQKTPYADSTVLSLKTREPAHLSRRGGTLVARLRDIRHRFLGEPTAVSFQRRIINGVGGPVAAVPVNWGWRPRGGFALKEGLQGLRAFLDMTCQHFGMHEGLAGRALEMLGVKGYGDFHRSDLIHTPAIRDYLTTVLDASGLLDGDLFDKRVVETLLAGGHGEHGGTLEKVFLLDVALAWRIFTSREYLLSALRVGWKEGPRAGR